MCLHRIFNIPSTRSNRSFLLNQTQSKSLFLTPGFQTIFCLENPKFQQSQYAGHLQRIFPNFLLIQTETKQVNNEQSRVPFTTKTKKQKPSGHIGKSGYHGRSLIWNSESSFEKLGTNVDHHCLHGFRASKNPSFSLPGF